MPRYNDSIEEQTAKKIHDSVWREGGGVRVFIQQRYIPSSN